MIDEIFATEAINGFLKRKKENTEEKTVMTTEETEAVISMLNKGNAKFMYLLLENIDPENENANKIKALFLGRIAIHDINIENFSKHDAIKHLSEMSSKYATDVLKELEKIK